MEWHGILTSKTSWSKNTFYLNVEYNIEHPPDQIGFSENPQNESMNDGPSGGRKHESTEVCCCCWCNKSIVTLSKDLLSLWIVYIKT